MLYRILIVMAAACFLPACSTPETPRMASIPKLAARGDVYKTEGENDHLIYDDALGVKTCIMLEPHVL